jgi:hypothetical protein
MIINYFCVLTKLCYRKQLLFYDKALLQRISDSNGCGQTNRISFKLITLDHSVNSLLLYDCGSFTAGVYESYIS